MTGLFKLPESNGELISIYLSDYPQSAVTAGSKNTFIINHDRVLGLHGDQQYILPKDIRHGID